MPDDGELLRQYAECRSEAAFAELVRRHLDMVYSAALRQTGGDSHRAEDVSQSVFVDLARKATALSGRVTLAGWLYIAAQRAASSTWRSERRRQAREREATIMQDSSDHTHPTPVWEELRPVLDEAIGQLGESDREAVLLRYFEGCAFADIGAKFRLSQDAARMRVDRALLRLQAVLARRGITSTGAALAALLADQAVSAAPAGLAASIGASAMAGASGAGAVSTLIQLMQITKVQIAVATIIFAAGAAIGVREIRANQDLRAEIASLRNENRALPELRAEHIRLIRAEADLNAAITEGEANAQAAAAARRSTRPTPKPIASLEEAMTKGPIYEANTLDQQPLAIDTAGIVYPSGMRQAGLGGKTTVDLVVAIDGSVVGAHAISATNAELADAAVKGVSQWVFKPGQKNGLPVNTHIQIPISFTVRSGP